MDNIFHLAIPTHDLDQAKDFYEKLYGVEIGRQNTDNFILNFFGHQVVCHEDLESKIESPRMYPRHFGLCLMNENDLLQLRKSVKEDSIIYQDIFTRFVGTDNEHQSFFLKDPSGNLLEFKCYKYKKALFN